MKRKAIVITYIPIRRERISETKEAKSMVLSEVNRMNNSAKISGLPKSKLSSRDGYLLKLSSEALKKEEYKRRSIQREKAYKKVGNHNQFYLTPRTPKFNLSNNFGTHRYPSSWVPHRNAKGARKKSQSQEKKEEKEKKKKPKKKKKKGIT